MELLEPTEEPQTIDAEPNSDADPPESYDDEPEDDVIVTAGDEAPPEVSHEEPAPKWVREVRNRNRELERQNRDLQRQLQAPLATEKNPVVELGYKPSLADHDYDEEKYEVAMASYFERKRKVDDSIAESRKAEESQKKAWEATLEAYSVAKTKLKVSDFKDAEHNIQQLFNVTQQGVVLQGAENPALVLYYLGRNPAKAKEFATIKDPVKFSFAVAKLEAQLKVTSRKTPPSPETAIKGSAPKSGTVDSHLDRLREEAQRTGNADRLMAYKRQQAAKSK